jgi:pSer/pThr/pTyr-binding forkhead associated (FHA) protein
MTRRSRPGRENRRAPEGRAPLTDEDVEVLRRDGALCTVTRLPSAPGTPQNAPPPPPSRVGLTAPSGQADVAPLTTTARHRPHDLCLADGTRARVTTAGLVVGRRRLAAADSDASSTPRLELTDETRSLSREHALVVVDSRGDVRVTDLGSGNGTTVRRPGGATIELVPGTPLTLAAGDVLTLGGTTASLQEAHPSS